MNCLELLDYLGTLNEEDRLVEIEKNADLIFSDTFINLIKGRLQFAAKEMAGAGYFDKVFPEENEEILLKIRKQIRMQSKNNMNTWLSMCRLNEGMNLREYATRTRKLYRVNHADEEDLFEWDYCIKCGLAGASTLLCKYCIVG